MKEPLPTIRMIDTNISKVCLSVHIVSRVGTYREELSCPGFTGQGNQAALSKISVSMIRAGPWSTRAFVGRLRNSVRLRDQCAQDPLSYGRVVEIAYDAVAIGTCDS